VGPDLVVVLHEAVELSLELPGGERRVLLSQELLYRLVETFDLAAGLGGRAASA
jgi:hypothetical protein